MQERKAVLLGEFFREQLKGKQARHRCRRSEPENGQGARTRDCQVSLSQQSRRGREKEKLDGVRLERSLRQNS